MTLRFTERANDEIQQAVFRYGASSRYRVESFLRRYRVALQRIQANPVSYPLEESAGGREIRSISIDRFPYSIIYEVLGELVVVLALWHHHGLGENWSRREG